MSRGVGRVRRRAFGEGLREQPGAVLVEALLQALRIQDYFAELAVGLRGLAGLDQVDDAAGGFGAGAEMQLPFLEPDSFQRAGGNFCESGGKVWRAEGAETVFDF